MKIYIYIIIMAVVTYLIRMLPLALFKRKIENKFIKSFLFYVPYAVLGAMTFPALFYSTGSTLSAIGGLVVGAIVAFFEKGLLTVAVSSCLAAFIVEMLFKLV